ARISAGMGIRAVSSPSHAITPQFQGSDRVDVALNDEHGGDRDFVLKYRLSGDGIQAGFLLYPAAPESYFLLMMEPPQRIVPELIPPREYIFVVDVSGSMRG